MTYKVEVKTLDGVEVANTTVSTKEEYEAEIQKWEGEKSPLNSLPGVHAVIITSYKDEPQFVKFATSTIYK